MAKIVSRLITVLLALAMQTAMPAQAQLARTFVSAATGNDANDCNRPTPCRTFQRAHDAAFDQGEVTVLDTGGYGAVTIRKSISIVSEVGEASLLVSGGATGITINAPNAYVNLRGLTIQGIGFGGGTGLQFNSGFALTITNCVIRNLTGDGIVFFPNGTAQLTVASTLIADNGGNGILHNGAAGANAVRIDLDRVEVRNNSSIGVRLLGVTGGLHTSIADSVISGNLEDALLVQGSPGQPSTAVVTRSIMSNNRAGGVTALGQGYVGIGQSLIAGNNTTWTTGNGGTVWSFGDNYVLGNVDGDPAITVIARK